MKWEKNKAEFSGNVITFAYEIEQVLSFEDTFIVLLAIPEDSDEINNIYCLDQNGRKLWQAEDLNVWRKGMLNLPYEVMEIKDEELYAADFYGRHYKINPKNGKILECILKK